MFLAYQYVVLSLMLTNVNSVMPQLGLGEHTPTDQASVRFVFVTPPTSWDIKAFTTPPNLWGSNVPSKPDFMGRFDTDKFSFGFSTSGCLVFISRINPWGSVSVAQRNDWLVKQHAVISTNDAYCMATNWLNKMSVNVISLDRKTPGKASQEFRWRPDGGGLKDLLPLFDVKWGTEPDVCVRIEIDGRTGELLCLRLEDNSLATHPGIVVRDWRELIRIPDPEFLAFSAKQRLDLVKRFSGLSQ
jgi:hypothetical protein